MEEEKKSGDDKTRSAKRQEEERFMYGTKTCEAIYMYVVYMYQTKELGSGLSRETEEV